MKFTTVVAVLALFGVITTNAVSIQSKLEENNVKKVFAAFTNKFQRSYKNQGEYQDRLSNFMKNYQIVTDHNNNNSDFQLEMNKFSDLSDREFQSMLGLDAAAAAEAQNDPEAEQFVQTNVDQSSYPASLDWRDKGVIAFMKNQASCGSCYAFNTLESIQALYHLKKGGVSNPADILNLSEQQIVDCSTSFGNQGCNGGLMSNTYNYLK